MWASVLNGYRQYATFAGRAGRRDFWWFFAYCLMLVLVPFLLFIPADKSGSDVLMWAVAILYMLATGAWLATFIPLLAVAVRRLHDTGRSGAALLLCFAGPGALIVLFYLARKGQDGDNAYGPPPASPDPAAR